MGARASSRSRRPIAVTIPVISQRQRRSAPDRRSPRAERSRRSQASRTNWNQSPEASSAGERSASASRSRSPCPTYTVESTSARSLTAKNGEVALQALGCSNLTGITYASGEGERRRPKQKKCPARRTRAAGENVNEKANNQLKGAESDPDEQHRLHLQNRRNARPPPPAKAEVT